MAAAPRHHTHHENPGLPAPVVPGTPVQWLSGVSGNWTTAADWTGGAVPGASSDVTIAAAGAYTVTINTTATAQSVLIDSAGATLADTAGGTLSVGTTLKIMAGTLALSTGASVTSGTLLVGTAGELLATGGTISASVTSSGLIHISSGTLVLEDGGTLAGKLTGAGTLALTNGTYGLGRNPISGPGNFAVYGGGTLSIAALKDLTLAGGLSFGAAGQNLHAGTVSGFGTLTTNGATSINADGTVAQMVLGNGITWINTGTVADAGVIDLNLVAHDTVALTNQAGATFDLTGDSASLLIRQVGNDSFANAGTLAKTGGTGTSLVNIAVSNTGLMEVVSGTLEVASLSGAGSLILDAGATFRIDNGGASSIAIAGADGTLAVGGSTFTVAAAQLSDLGALSILAGTLAIDTSGALSDLDAILGSGTLSIATGADIVIGGPLALGQAGSTLSLINGTMTTTGATTAHALILGSGFDWINNGSIQFDGSIINTDYSAVITNNAGSVINLNNEAIGCTIDNAGTLTVAGGTMKQSLNSTGTIDVTGGFNVYSLQGAGTLSMSAGATLTAQYLGFAGTVVGTNLYLDVTGGLTTSAAFLSSFSTFTLANNAGMTFDGASGTISLPIGLHGNYVTIDTGTDISLSNAFSITQGGAVGPSTLSGPGTLTTLGVTTVTGEQGKGPGFTLGNGIVWSNAGTVKDGGRISLNESSNDSVTIINNAGATFGFMNGGSILVTANNSGTDTFVNNGTLALLSSSIANIEMTVINNGLINVGAGNLEIGSFSGSGSISVAAGATLGASIGTLATSNSIVGTLAISELTLTAGTLTANVGSAIGVGGYQFTIGAAASFLSTGNVGVNYYQISNAGQIEAGAGTLAIIGDYITNTGRLLATNGATLNLAGVDLENLSNATLTGGTYRANTSSIIELASNTTITTDSANITLGGPDAEIQSLNTATNTQITLQSTLSTITAGATLSLASGAAFTATADAGTFTNQGTLILLQAAFSTTELDIASTGTLTGYATIGGTVVNAGAITATKGALNFLGAVTNTGAISAGSESLSITGAVAGAGTLELAAAGTLALLGGAAATQSVDFLATTGVLDIAQAVQFDAQIGGFAASDQIDLLKTLANGLNYANGVLTVTENQTVVANLNFTGAYSTASFTLTTDGHNGSLISFV